MFLFFVRIYRISLFFLECPPRILCGFMWRLQKSLQLVIVRLIYFSINLIEFSQFWFTTNLIRYVSTKKDGLFQDKRNGPRMIAKTTTAVDCKRWVFHPLWQAVSTKVRVWRARLGVPTIGTSADGRQQDATWSLPRCYCTAATAQERRRRVMCATPTLVV